MIRGVKFLFDERGHKTAVMIDLRQGSQVRDDFPNQPGFSDDGDEADVTAAVRALEWKVVAGAGEELVPGDAGGVVGTSLVVPCTRTPALSRRETGSRGVPIAGDVTAPRSP